MTQDSSSSSATTTATGCTNSTAFTPLFGTAAAFAYFGAIVHTTESAKWRRIAYSLLARAFSRAGLGRRPGDHDVDDLLSSALVALSRRAETFDPPLLSDSRYLFRVLQRGSWRVANREARESTLLDSSRGDDETGDTWVDCIVDTRMLPADECEARATVVETVRRLHDGLRELLISGQSGLTLADYDALFVQGPKSDAIRTQRSRARRKLERWVGDLVNRSAGDLVPVGAVPPRGDRIDSILQVAGFRCPAMRAIVARRCSPASGAA